MMMKQVHEARRLNLRHGPGRTEHVPVHYNLNETKILHWHFGELS
jgi:hypothetical protein